MRKDHNRHPAHISYYQHSTLVCIIDAQATFLCGRRLWCSRVDAAERPRDAAKTNTGPIRHWVSVALARFVNVNMLFKSLLVLTTALTGVNNAAPALHRVLHESRSTPVASWQKIGTIDARTVLPMRVGLTQSKVEAGRRALIDM
jgi:hypothetical protein